MRMCNEAITIYNARLDGTTGYDVYHRSVIFGASWFCDTLANVTSSGLKAANKFVIRIPIDANFGGKTYLPPTEYAEVDSPEMYFTLQEGDFIIRGIASEGAPRPATLHEKYNEVATILGVTDNRRARFAPHWKVVGA